MKKHLRKLFLLMLIFTPLIFSGCKPNAYYGQITSLNVVTGDEEALVSWTNTELYNGYYFYLSIYDSEKSWYIDKASNPCLLRNTSTQKVFTNGKAITFTLYVKDKSGSTVNAKSITVTPSASNEIVIDADDIDDAFTEIPKDKGIVKISGINGKSVAYVNYNSSTSKEIVAGTERNFSYALGFNDDTNSNANTISANESARAALSEDSGMTMPEIKEPLTRHFTPPEKVTVVKSSARAAETDEEETFDINSPAIGQTHYIYVDNNYAITQFVKEKMTLYAIGNQTTDDTSKIKALVWVNPDNVAEESSGDKVSLNVIKDIISKYTKYYALEEDIFGETGDFILNKSETDNKLIKEDMANSPTSTYINIVLTDIGKDYNSSTKSGVVGYFWGGKDYYKKELKTVSNEGKYFYIDIPYCNYISSATSTEELYGGTGKVSDMVISTLFHEYQHMIHFNQKYNVESDEDTSWYNEMLSMLCEDIMAETLGLEETVQDERIPDFNIYYPLSGISEYLDSESWISYGTAYAFGAWLARNYGGVNLVEEMSKNDYVGKESIVNAVKDTNNTSLTWDDLVKEYLQAVVFRSAYSQANDLPTFNKTLKGSDGTSIESTTIKIATSLETPNAFANTYVSADTISGSFNGINLWADAYAIEEGNHKWYGPLTFYSGKNDIRPDGFVIHNTGSNWDGGDYDYVKLYFTGTDSDTEKLYLFVQDGFSYYTEDTTEAEVIDNRT